MFANEGFALSCDKRHMSQSDFIRRMREAMKAQGVTQGQLAEAAGITSQSAVSNIFKGTRRIRVEEKAAFERRLGLSDQVEAHWLPAIDLSAAAEWQVAVKTPRKSVPLASAGPHAFAILVESQEAGQILPDGGWMAIDPDQTSVFVGKLYLAIGPGERCMPVRYLPDPARLTPLAEPSEKQAWKIGRDHFTIIGRVIAYGCDLVL